IYAEPAIQQVISELLFKNKNDVVICWKQYYYPFPHITFAITLMAIECGLDKWASSKWELINLSENNYKSIYNSHLACLDKFATVTVEYGLLPKLLQLMYDNG
ncbi:hypothetical protein J3R82DRAFT_5061, partial [Butyriboletus roseoflavus]